MRTRSAYLAMALLWASPIASIAAAADFEPEGKWKLTFLTDGVELLVFDVAGKDGGFEATLVDSFAQLGPTTIQEFSVGKGTVALVFNCGVGELAFKGAPVAEGDDAGAVLGVVRLRGNPFPARLDKTDAAKVQPPKQDARQKLFAAVQTQDAKEKVKRLEELLHESPGPSAHQAYIFLVQSAEAGGLSEDQLRKHVEAWVAGAKPYGAEWTAQCRIAALQGLQGKKAYAKLALELAQQAKKELPKDATLDQQAAVTQGLAAAARLAGKDELADKADAELAAIDARLDEEYHAKVPPFKPDSFAGRQDPKHDRVVMLELFTGAQCPPCVTADVGFDGLLATYQPSELVALQYHLHIPGPDPLTNPDSIARSQYYAVRGTPSTFFNGQTAAGGGGGMDRSKVKYDEFRGQIDEQLGGAKAAKIDLDVTRSGETIIVRATAQADRDENPKDDGDKEDDDKDDDEGDNKGDDDSSKLRLRIALTEEAVRYVGGNGLRFHHHVVRGFPGGVEGKPLVAGEGNVELTIDLAEIRDGLSKYLKGSGFPAALPKIDLKGLAVVAFVQDDADKRILHVVQASLAEAP